MVRVGELERALELAQDLLLNDPDFETDHALRRAQLMVVSAEARFRLDRENGKSLALTYVRQSLKLCETVQGHLLHAVLETRSASDALMQASLILAGKPNALLEQEMRDVEASVID